MRLLRSSAREVARSVAVCLVVFGSWAVMGQGVATQAPAPGPPAGGTAAPPAGGRGGDPAAGRGGRGRGALTPFAKEALAALR